MGPTRDGSPDPTRASGSACPPQATRSPWYLASAVVFSERHPRPHSFTTHPAVGAEGYDIRTIQEVLGHKDVNTTMIYTQVPTTGVQGVRSSAVAL